MYRHFGSTHDNVTLNQAFGNGTCSKFLATEFGVFCRDQAIDLGLRTAACTLAIDFVFTFYFPRLKGLKTYKAFFVTMYSTGLLYLVVETLLQLGFVISYRSRETNGFYTGLSHVTTSIRLQIFVIFLHSIKDAGTPPTRFRNAASRIRNGAEGSQASTSPFVFKSNVVGNGGIGQSTLSNTGYPPSIAHSGTNNNIDMEIANSIGTGSAGTGVRRMARDSWDSLDGGNHNHNTMGLSDDDEIDQTWNNVALPAPVKPLPSQQQQGQQQPTSGFGLSRFGIGNRNIGNGNSNSKNVSPKLLPTRTPTPTSSTSSSLQQPQPVVTTSLTAVAYRYRPKTPTTPTSPISSVPP
ncbi:hypothetical protein HDU76_008405, partial [Blyttiomyces sp. JEL0837]